MINETLRIRPPSPFTGRYTAGDYRLGGYTVPAGTRIVPHIGEVNLNAETYDDPHEFRPERFLDAEPADLCVDSVRRRHQALPRRELQCSRAHRCSPNAAALRTFRSCAHDQDRQVRRGIVLLPHRGVLVRYYRTDCAQSCER